MIQDVDDIGVAREGGIFEAFVAQLISLVQFRPTRNQMSHQVEISLGAGQMQQIGRVLLKEHLSIKICNTAENANNCRYDVIDGEP